MPNYSTFTADQGYIVDIFPIKYSLPASQYTNANRLRYLKSLTSPTSDEQTEINNLTITLQSYDVGVDQFNAFTQAISSMESLILKIVNFEDQGEYSSLTTYDLWNSVTMNGQTYISKQDNNLNHTPVGGISDIYWSLASKKGSSFRPLGVWSNATSYVNNTEYIDIVYSNGSTFYCIQSNTNQQPSQAIPPVSTAYWGIFSSIGERGETGYGVGLNPKGLFSISTPYYIDDLLQYNGNLYRCTVDSIGHFPTDINFWELFLAGNGENLATLTTDNKASLVLAINEVDSHTDTANTNIGTLSSLTTTAKDNLVNAINENSQEISVLMGSSALVMTSTQDINSRTTNITYTRSDASTYKTIDYSNFDANNKPQTVVTKLYSSTSVLETTNTATVVWNTDGTYVISSSEVMS